MDEQPSSPPFNPLDYPILFEPPQYVQGLGWEEHIPFAMCILDVHRPRKFVELGVQSGDSYLAFCQAINRLGIEVSCWGVDTWRGDAHAGHYGNQVLDALRPKHAPFEKFSKLMQMTFDQALELAEDGSVDLLHIDGFHTYDAVRHDFDTWLPKMSERGIVLFHDTCERGREFGVWKLWAELQERFPTFSFEHGHGLGVLFAGKELGDRSAPFFRATQDPKHAPAIRSFFSAVGANIGAQVRAPRALPAPAAPAPSSQVQPRIEREWAALKTRIAAIDVLLRTVK